MENVAKTIGYVVYAVAKADRKIKVSERATIHRLIDENWNLLADSEDPFGVRAMEYIDKMIVELEKKNIKSEEAFLEFKESYQIVKNEFSSDLKDFLLKLCVETAGSFNRMNKSELVLVSRIEMILIED